MVVVNFHAFIVCLTVKCLATTSLADVECCWSWHWKTRSAGLRSVASSLLLLRSFNRLPRRRPTTSATPQLIAESVRHNLSVVHYPMNVKQGWWKVCKKNTTLGCGVCKNKYAPCWLLQNVPWTGCWQLYSVFTVKNCAVS